MELLWISLCTPFDGVSHAGGKTVNFYQSYFAKDKSVHIRLVTFCSKEEEACFDKSRYDSGMELIVVPKGMKKFIWNCLSIHSKINPFYKYGDALSSRLAHEMIKRLVCMQKEGYRPDVVILEWTAVVLYAEMIRALFPKANFAAVEHDVTFQAYARETAQEKSLIRKKYKNLRAANMFRREIRALEICDRVVVQNKKDRNLLCRYKVNSSKIKVIAPYYHRSRMQHHRKNHNIIYFGYMKRKENITAVRWFARYVMPLLSDLDCEFVVIGKGGRETAGDLESDKIHMTGYVENIDRWFAEGMCFVAPLSLGAGIKVKCIEAMYAGIPVLTNKIGIEGIPAAENLDYYNCSSPQDYAKVIRRLYDSDSVNMHGRNVIEKEFQLEKSAESYLGMIKEMAK